MYPLDSIGILIHQQLISSLDQNPSIQFRSEIMDRPEHLPEPAVLPATDPGRSWGNKEMREAEDRYDTCRVTLYINNNTNIKQHYYIRIHDIIYMYIYYIVSMMYISDIFPAWYRTLLMLYRCSATRHLAPIETTGGNPKWVCLKIWHPTESTGLSSLVITFFHFPYYSKICWRMLTWPLGWGPMFKETHSITCAETTLLVLSNFAACVGSSMGSQGWGPTFFNDPKSVHHNPSMN